MVSLGYLAKGFMTLCCFHCGKTINMNFIQSSLFHGNVQTTTKYSRRSVFCFKAKHCLTKKRKAKRKKRLVWKKKNENAKKKCLQEQRFQFNRKRRDNCMLSDAKNGELITNNVDKTPVRRQDKFERCTDQLQLSSFALHTIVVFIYM